MRRGLIPLILLLGAAPAAAQDRPFVFSISTPPAERSHATLHLDTSAGGAFDVVDNTQAVQRLGLQASLGERVTLVAKMAFTTIDDQVDSMQEAEMLYSVLRRPASGGSLAVGMGLRHEIGGANVLLGRVVGGRRFSAWRVDGNALFEKPYETGRDAADVIVSAGIARAITGGLHAGIEMIGEDLEGFWEMDEAEGGARMLVGPSLRFAPERKRWQLLAAGGPLFYATRSGGQSDAARPLPRASGNGWAARASFGYTF